MKTALTRLRKLLAPGLLGCILALGAAAGAYAQDPYKNYSEEVFMDMDFEPNLTTPVVGAKEKAAVKKAVSRAANGLKGKYTVDLMRDGEVFVVSIPASELFLPNDTLLCPHAAKTLAGVLGTMQNPLAYKILLAMHTDDTGSEKYREALSLARLNSVYDWFVDQVEGGILSDGLIIIPFSMGSSMPVKPNDSMANRSENRRLEIYFVPGPATIKPATTKSKSKGNRE